MTTDQVAWVIRTVMVAVAAVATYLLAQTDITLEPAIRVLLGAILVALAALNPVTVANKVTP